MNVVDIAIGVILIVGLLWGLSRGFIRMLFGLAALVLGIIAAGRMFAFVAEKVLFFLPGERVSEVAGFAVVFLIVFLAIVLTARLIGKALKLAALGWLDRLAGGLLGFIMASLWVGAFLLLAVIGGFHQGRVLASSKLAPQVFGVTDAIVMMIPEDVWSDFDEDYERLRKEWGEAKVRKSTVLVAVEAPDDDLNWGREVIAT